MSGAKVGFLADVDKAAFDVKHPVCCSGMLGKKTRERRRITACGGRRLDVLVIRGLRQRCDG